MKRISLSVLLGAIILLPWTDVAAKDYQVGDRAECSGQVGIIARFDPRIGWDEPFAVVEVKSSGTTYEFKCVPSQLKAPPPAPSAPSGGTTAPNRKIGTKFSSAGTATQPRTQATGPLCKVGAKLEGQWGISWYSVTVLQAPNANGQCAVSFDGYGRDWDTLMNPDQLRPRTGLGVYERSPSANTIDNESEVAATSDAPDGDYRCHKISPGGQLMDIGDLTIENGEATMPGMPDGWTILSVSLRGTKDGEPLVALDYRSSSGFNDRLDCIPD